jgi:hypothetical protein
VLDLLLQRETVSAFGDAAGAFHERDVAHSSRVEGQCH